MFFEKNLKEFFNLIHKNELIDWKTSDFPLQFKTDIMIQDMGIYHTKDDWQRWILQDIVIQIILDYFDHLEKIDTSKMNRLEYQEWILMNQIKLRNLKKNLNEFHQRKRHINLTLNESQISLFKKMILVF